MDTTSNLTRYSPGVLIGNWYEDMRVREDKVDYYRSRMNYDNSCHTLSGMEKTYISEASCTWKTGGVVMLGQPLQLISVNTGGSLAIDTESRLPTKSEHEFLLTATTTAAPQNRMTWVITRANDENNIGYTQQLKEEHVLHYGQHVRIVNENAHPEGFLYLRSNIRDIGQPTAQQVVASLGTDKDNIFVVVKPGEKRDDIRNGGPVRVGDEFALYHSTTNQPIQCTRKLQKTTYGFEFEVNCSFAGENRSRSLGSVTSHPGNLFFVAAENPNARKAMTVSSLRDITGRGVTEASPRDSDDGLTSTISRIREGVLLFGGRLGFRILSKVLGVACKEHNIVGIRRQDLFHSICLMGATIQPGELDVIFKKFDHNGNGVIIAQDLLRELRGGMPPTRLNAVITAFQQLIIEGGGSVDYGDMLNLFQFNAACHPDVEDGIVSREEVIFDFINCWPGMNAASSVTTDMFVAYYTDISPASESDERFVAVVQRSWKIPETDAYKTVKSNRSVTVIRLDGTSTVVQLPASLVLDATDQATVRNFLTRSGVRDIKEVRLSM